MKDEARLIDAALQGNSAAYGDLVRKYQDRLFTSVVHVVGCHEEAEDVVQDAFVQAYLKLKTFKRTSSFYTWLYRIAFNTAVSRQRRKKPEVSVDGHRETSGSEPLDPHDSPGDRMMRQERVAQVQAALATLSEEFRAVMVLREIEGCDYDTISDILDISLGTVRSRLHRARALMREQLKGVQQTHSTE